MRVLCRSSVVDLGSAPGSWSQVARERLLRPGGDIDGRIIALDLLAMEPIAGVDFILGDFREQEVLEQLEQLLDGRKVNLVISDMAPNLSGVASADSARIQHVCDLALDFAGRSEEHTSELQSLMRISYAVFCLKKKKNIHDN